MNSQPAADVSSLFEFTQFVSAASSLCLFVPKCHTQYCTVPWLLSPWWPSFGTAGPRCCQCPQWPFGPDTCTDIQEDSIQSKPWQVLLGRVGVLLSLDFCWSYIYIFEAMFSFNSNIFRPRNSAKWQTLMASCKFIQVLADVNPLKHKLVHDDSELTTTRAADLTFRGNLGFNVLFHFDMWQLFFLC